MDLEDGGVDCSYDGMKIIDGGDEHKYCGTMDDVPDDMKYVESKGKRNQAFCQYNNFSRKVQTIKPKPID